MFTVQEITISLTSCSFTKPLNLQNLCLSLLHITVIHFDLMSPSFLLLPSSSLRPLQSCSRGRQKSNLSPLLTFQNVIFDSTWVMWSVFTVCSCQGFLGCSSTVSWVPPVPHTSSSSNTPQPHRRVIPDSQCKPALSCFPKPQSQSSDPACCRAQTQSTSKIKLCDQASFTKGNFSPATPEHKRISGQG